MIALKQVLNIMCEESHDGYTIIMFWVQLLNHVHFYLGTTVLRHSAGILDAINLIVACHNYQPLQWKMEKGW